ncbi:MAG: hypothetical protein GY861_16715 [bacterium]|nr:hypothetical protein [bacterium]
MFDKKDPEVQKLLLQCMRSTRVFAKTFFPHEVEKDFSPLHDKIFAVMDDPDWRKKGIAAPRGMGKTTLAKIKVVKGIVFRESNFVVYLSNSATSAEESTEHIKRMMQENELLRAVFGDVKCSQKGFKDGFSKKSWVAYGDVYVLPRGNGQQVRGKNWMGHRPGLIVIDDLEDTELVRSEEQRNKLSTWFFSDLMKTESKFGKPTEFVYIDTIKHEDSLLKLLVDSSDWLSVDTPNNVLSICDDNFNTYDPNYMTTEEIKQEYLEHKEKGKTDLFYMEYMNIPISLKDAIFKDEYFKYYEEGGSELLVTKKVDALDTSVNRSTTVTERIPVKELETVVIVDPARTVKLHAAESAVVVFSVHRRSKKLFLRSIYGKKVRPDELYDEIFRCILMYGARFLAVEVTGLHEFISQPIKGQMKLRGIYPTYLEINAKGDKDTRISTLAPSYRLGYIYHNISNCEAAENQLRWHPKSKRKDIIDAMSYITKIIDDEYLYFDPEDDEDGEDEFYELMDDPLEEDDWRII